MSTTTPYMSLDLPVPGPSGDTDWADLIVSAFDVVDSHDHSSGKGVKVTPAGININATLDFNSNILSDVYSVKLDNQGSSLSSSYVRSIYVSGGNLYFNNSSGTAVQITSGSSVNVSGVGGITGDYSSSSASVSYSNTSKTYTFYQGTTNTSYVAKIASGDLLLYDASNTHANYVQFICPTSLPSSYSLTFASALPASTLPVSVSSSGTLSYAQLATAQISDSAVTTAKIAAGAVTSAKLDTNIAISGTLDVTGALTSGGVNAFRENHIINGGFEWWQRGTSFAAIASAAYSSDRWKYLKSGSMVHTVSRVSDAPTVGSTAAVTKYAIEAALTTADTSIGSTDYARIAYQMEGRDLRRFAGKTFTLSFWVKATTTGTYCVSFRNQAGDRSYVAEYTINSTATWEKKTITVTHDTSGTWDYDETLGINISWALASGSAEQTTAGSWQSGNYTATSNQVNGVNTGSTSFRLSQVMLNLGSVAASFNYYGGSLANEFLAAQRYYQNAGYGATGRARSNAAVKVAATLPRIMRIVPTVGLYATTGLTWEEIGVADRTASGTVSISENSANDRGWRALLTNSASLSMTAGNGIIGTTDLVTLDAEF